MCVSWGECGMCVCRGVSVACVCVPPERPEHHKEKAAHKRKKMEVDFLGGDKQGKHE